MIMKLLFIPFCITLGEQMAASSSNNFFAFSFLKISCILLWVLIWQKLSKWESRPYCSTAASFQGGYEKLGAAAIHMFLRVTLIELTGTYYLLPLIFRGVLASQWWRFLAISHHDPFLVITSSLMSSLLQGRSRTICQFQKGPRISKTTAIWGEIILDCSSIHIFLKISHFD